VAAFATGDTARLVRTGVTGVLVEDGDIEALADGIAFLADHPEERKKMGEAAKRIAASTFVSWDERTSMEFDIIESFLR
jgi:glycosyltransferase involved in cell wall biosynthesis